MLRSFAFFSGLAAAAAFCVSSASAQCVPGGVGGAFPAAGTGGGGTFSTTLPPSPYSNTASFTVPSGATVLKSVKINNVTHTWSGDSQWVLTSPAGPAGVRYNILCGMPTDWSADFGGSYELVDPIQLCGGVPAFDWVTDPIPSGTYLQDFGGYTNNNNLILNTPIEQIPIASGSWTLTVYDWVGGDVGSFTDWELCFGTPTPPPPPQYPQNSTCVAGGTGTPYGAGVDGTWPTTLPSGSNVMTSSSSITVPAGSTKINQLRLLNWNHTWVTDSMVVLTNPAGVSHLIYEGDGGSNCGGCSEDLNGDYEFVDAVAGAGGVCAGGSDPFPVCTTGGAIAPGSYLQDFGTWPTGSSGINNTLLESIPISTGTWTLTIYDWCGGFDNGSLGSWELCFDTVSVTVGDCQILPTVTQTCQSVASSSGAPSATSGSGFTTTFGGLNAQVFGVVFYGVNGPITVAWSAQSNLCVKAPTTRLGGVSGASGNTGGVIGNCDGQYSFDMNAQLLADGIPQGTSVVMQAWQRDPASAKTTQLSDSLNFNVGP